MEIIIQDQKEVWNNFLIGNQGSFLQSWEWGSFQELLGKKVWRLAIGESERIFLQAQIIKEEFPFRSKSFLYLPFGPTWQKNLSDEKIKEILTLLWQRVGEIAKSEQAVFCLTEPLNTLPEINGFNLEKPTKRIQPEETLILDLSQPEEAIFSHFNSITRYNIRLAQRKGVVAKEAGPTDENIAIFYSLLAKTSQRDKFSAYPKAYYQKLFQAYRGPSPVNPVRLLFAQYQGKVVTANILVYFGQRATHLHGASDYEYRAIKAPQFLQWHQIKQAKEAGFTEYDFWGISAKQWPSLTEYKKGFGGKEISYPQGQGIVFQRSWHNLYRLVRKFLKK